MQLFFLVALVIVVLIGIAVSKAKKTDHAWRIAAERLGLSFRSGGPFESRRLVGEHAGYAVRVDTFSRGSDKSSTRHTRYRVAYEALGLGLDVKREGFFSGVKKLLGAQDIEVGDRTFDAAFVVKGDRPDAVRRFLTPARRRVVERAFARFEGISITDTGLLFSRRGVDGESRLVATVEALCDVAWELATESGERRPSTRGIVVVAEEVEPVDLEMIVSAAPLEEVASAASLEPDSFAIAEPFSAAEPARTDGPAPDAEPEPAGGHESPDGFEPAAEPDLAESAAEACAAIFVPGRMSHEAQRTFDERYAGRSVRWQGELQRVETTYSDPVFGSERGARALLKIHTVGGTALGAGDVRAVVQLPLAAAEELKDRAGETFELTGRLVRCDPYMRQLFVADGTLS